MPAEPTGAEHTGRIRIEVVYAWPERQALIPLQVPAGTTVQQAIDRAALGERFPGDDLSACAVGVWGRPVGRDRPVRNGDRIELYRELGIDPREARRRLAQAGRTMSRAGPGGGATSGGNAGEGTA